jgi:hypothetical protein
VISARVAGAMVVTSLGIAGGAGCTVGDGNGAARGPIYVQSCSADGDYGAPKVPADFDLQPHFFAGEPIEDISGADPATRPTNPVNRLLMRIQRNGNRIEVNDTIYFDAQNIFEVGRCVRGRINPDGTPDYLTRGLTDLRTGLPTGPPWCDWSGGAADGDGGAGADADTDAGAPPPAPDGGVLPVIGRRARINLGADELLRASLSLLFTCHGANQVGMSFGGWIEFQDFGGAAQPDLPPDQRGQLKPADFRINFGDRLRATFHVELEDQHIYYAIKQRLPVPDSSMHGTIDGFFDFDLERGRAAQPFP